MQLAGTPQAQKPREDASVEGIVVRLDNGEPLRRAQLTLYQVRPSTAQAASQLPDSDNEPTQFPPIAPFMTAADGKFRFTKLPAGSYRLAVSCNGFVSTAYGSVSGQGEGTIITIAAGQVIKDITFRLRAAATLSGHIRDSEGNPVPGVDVSLLSLAFYPNGMRLMERVAFTTTDDRGEYRLFWVTPGRYYLSSGAFGSGLTSNVVQEKLYSPFYYPGTFNLKGATVIEVVSGTEMGAMDMIMPRPLTYSVQGTILDVGGGPPPKRVNIELLPRSEDAAPIDLQSSGMIRVGDIRYTNGIFEITNVLPGPYLIRASTSRDFNSPLAVDAIASVRSPSDLFRVAFSSTSSAVLPVDVFASDISGLKMTLAAGVRVPLRVSVEGREFSSLLEYEKIRAHLQPRRDSSDGSYGQSASVNSEGLGAFENTRNGEYRIRVEQLPTDFYLKTARMDNVDVLNGFWKFSGTPTGVVNVVLGDNPGRVEGSLSDSSSKPVPGVQVVLIPENFRHRNELYKTVDTDESGRFAFRGVAPGDYRVFSWEELEPNSWFDPEVLSKYEQQGKLVHVTEGSQESVDIKLIRTSKE